MQWNTDVRKAMTMELGRRCIQNGLEITQKSQPLCREELKKITEELLNQNTEDAIQRRIIFVSAFLSVGRSGEVAKSEWTSSYWQPSLQQHVYNWNRSKTCRQNQMGNMSDGEGCFEVDYFHAMASYMILGGN